jgi:hypothetical protein
MGTWIIVEIDYQNGIALGASAGPTVTNILWRLVKRSRER